MGKTSADNLPEHTMLTLLFASYSFSASVKTTSDKVDDVLATLTSRIDDVPCPSTPVWPADGMKLMGTSTTSVCLLLPPPPSLMNLTTLFPHSVSLSWLRCL